MRLRLIMIYIMIGTPIMGVIALIGMMPWGEVTLSSEHKSATAAPVSIVTGSSRPCSDVLRASLAMCGTTSPKKPIGPQNAVTTAVSTPVMSKSRLRVRWVLTPRFWAYRVPNSNAFKGFIMSNEATSDNTIIVPNTGSCSSACSSTHGHCCC